MDKPSPGQSNTVQDGIDRIKELLLSAIDQTQSQISQTLRIADRICGRTNPADIGRNSEPPTPPLQDRSVYNLLNDLERYQRDLNNQLARFREQLP